MSLSTTIIRVPNERASQLRSLAAFKNISISNLVGDLVASEVNRLGLTREIGLGGFDVAAIGSDVFLSSHPLGNFEWPASVAKSIGQTLIQFGESRRRLAAYCDVDASLVVEVTGNGTGLRLRNLENGITQAVTRSVVSDLGRWIVAEASEAER